MAALVASMIIPAGIVRVLAGCPGYIQRTIILWRTRAWLAMP